MNLFVILRFLIGGLLVFSGFQKVTVPYQNFQYIIQGYEIIPSSLESIVAIGVPWAELFIGLFLILGLWLPWMLRLSQLLFSLFVLIIAQALLRGINLEECGCFGDMIAVPAWLTMSFDVVIVALLAWMQKSDKTRRMSIDEWFT